MVSATSAQAADPVTIQLLGINDFHGRIEAGTSNLTTKFATTIEQLRNADGDEGDNTALIGAGDLIGASLFASASQQDQPTIDVLNALDLDASAVGNHEFDQGFDDLENRVINNGTNAEWSYLGANVYEHGTTTPALPEYSIVTIGGLDVGIIGAVTQETPTLVSPDGVATLDFGDPVEAVNRVAAAIDDQVDVTVATYHEGAPEGTPDGSTLEEEVEASPAFASIVNQTSPAVDAIFTGHTHKAYAWEGQVPGADEGVKRPIVQTGNYAQNVGKVSLTVDPDTGAVSAHTQENVAASTTVNTDFPRVQAVKTIVDAAVAQAAIVGNEPVGEVTADITTAFAGEPPARDDRASESTLGNLVANALRDSLVDTPGGADLGIVNPGGLRAELLFAGDTSQNPDNTDGVITYAEANGVLPFVNNLGTVALTGAQLKAVLEQQWQPAGATRPYLHLGLSDNVQVTVDPTQETDHRVMSVLINGVPIQAAENYKVATFSFLAAGGDNFTAFKGGTYVDSGLVDRDAWIDYLGDHSPISPSFARRQVTAVGMPAEVSAGQEVSFTLSKLDLTSKGSPANTTVDVYLRALDGSERRFVDSYDVTNGSVSIGFTAPADLDGNFSIVAIASPSGTTVGRGYTATQVTVAPIAPAVYGIPSKVTVFVDSAADATGVVELFDEREKSLGEANVVDGKAVFTVSGTALEPGTHALRAEYYGDVDLAPGDATRDLTVAKAKSTTKATVKPKRIKAKKTAAKVTVKVTATGFKPAGKVTIKLKGKVVGKGAVKNGKAVVKLKKFTSKGRKKLVVSYAGGTLAKASKKTITIKVVK